MITITELENDKAIPGRKVFTLDGPVNACMSAGVMVLATCGGITYDISNVYVIRPNVNAVSAWQRAKTVIDWLNSLELQESANV
jgi:hydroxymethylglutaryl-CoA reductase